MSDTAGQGAGEGGAADAATAGAQGGEGAAAAAVAPVRPDGLPDDLWDASAGVKTGDLWARHQETAQKLADAEAARGQVPADHTGYQVSVPDGFTLPAGVELNPTDPFLQDAQKFAHQQGWSEGTFKQVMALEALHRAGTARFDQEWGATQDKALGDNHAARRDAIKTWATANLPTDEAAALTRLTRDATFTKAMERVIASRQVKPGPAGGAPLGKFNDIKDGDGAARLAAIRSKAA